MASVASSTRDSLLDALSRAVGDIPGEHKYSVQVLRSKPRRSYALFPYASNRRTAKIWQEEVLVVLSEERDVPIEVDQKESAAGEAASEQAATGTSGSRRALLPIVGLEASIYTFPSTSSSILYISKVDTTGLQPSTGAPNPTRSLVSAFLAHHFAHPPHDTTRLRVHIFAKSQPQYLFPGSVDNKGKKVLDDKGLIRWWKSCLDQATTQHSSVEGATSPQLFYLIPGLSHLESLPYVPASNLPSAAKWTYSHPNSTLPSVLHPSTTAPSDAPITDHIPAFPDDPKSRFITSLTSSAVASSGNEHDYDDVMISIKSATLSTGSGRSAHGEEVEAQREKEGRRMKETEGGMNGWWEQMAWRQECCSGVLVGFFVAAIEPAVPAAQEDPEVTAPKAPRAARTAVDHALFTRLWSQFHNVDYAVPNLIKCAAMAEKWAQDVESGTKAEVEQGAEKDQDEAVKRARSAVAYDKEVKRIMQVSNPLLPVAEKRPAEATPVVNKMVPRKKKPKVA